MPNEFVLTQAKKFFGKAIKDAINETYNDQYTAKFVLYTKFSNSNDLLLDLKKLLNVKEAKVHEHLQQKN
ncbi:MAG: hypothetical protein WCG98_05760 [bacterium]